MAGFGERDFGVFDPPWRKEILISMTHFRREKRQGTGWEKNQSDLASKALPSRSGLCPGQSIMLWRSCSEPM